MKTVELYNLHLGGERHDARFSEVQVGPFQVKLLPDYEVRVKRLTQRHTKHEAFDMESGEWRTTGFTPALRGQWEVTATATFEPQESAAPSVLYRGPYLDHGLWDLCSILSFVTGRRVAIAEDLQNHSPHAQGDHACIPIETLRAAATAWNHRQDVVEQHLEYALLLYNEAFGQNILQSIAALYNTSLNIVLDRAQLKTRDISREAKSELKTGVQAAVEACGHLSPEERIGMKNLLCGRVEQGLSSMNDKLMALLASLGVIDDLGTLSSDAALDAQRRIQFVNAVRNRLTHVGDLPKLKGLNGEQSERYAFTIGVGVVPSIIRMALGRVLGFRPNSVGSLCQHPDELRKLFVDGIWRGWALEKVSFDEWFNTEVTNPQIDPATAESSEDP